MLLTDRIPITLDGDPAGCRIVFWQFPGPLIVYSLLDPFAVLRSAEVVVAITTNLQERLGLADKPCEFAELRTSRSDKKIDQECFRYFQLIREVFDDRGIGVRFVECEIPAHVHDECQSFIRS